jgi:hypothetical protein
MNNEKIEELKQLHYDISMASEFDFEVTIQGNGCNAFEVSPCIKEVFRILEIPEPIYNVQQKIDYLKNLDYDPDVFYEKKIYIYLKLD